MAPNQRKYRKGDKVTVSLRMTEELKRELEVLAQHFGMGFSEFVTEGLDQWASFNREHVDQKKGKN